RHLLSFPTRRSSDLGKLYALTPELEEIWMVPFQTGGNIESSPAVGLSGVVFVGSDDGYLYAINPDGTEKWSFQTGGPIKSSPRRSEEHTSELQSREN